MQSPSGFHQPSTDKASRQDAEVEQLKKKLIAVQGQLETLLAQQDAAAVPVVLRVEIADREAGDNVDAADHVRLELLTARMLAAVQSIEQQLPQHPGQPSQDMQQLGALIARLESELGAALDSIDLAQDMLDGKVTDQELLEQELVAAQQALQQEKQRHAEVIFQAQTLAQKVVLFI